MDYKPRDQTASLGIVYAIVDPVKHLSTPNHYSPTDTAYAGTRTRQQPLKISIVFDHADSASEAEVLIRHGAADNFSQTRLFSFEKLIQPETSLTIATYRSNKNILDLIGPSAGQVIPPIIAYFPPPGKDGQGEGEHLN